MTTSDATVTLSKAFDQVLLTPAQAANILGRLAYDLRDISPETYTALMTGSDNILNPPSQTSATSTSKSSTSGT